MGMILTASDSCETIDQSASRLIDDVIKSTNKIRVEMKLK